MFLLGEEENAAINKIRILFSYIQVFVKIGRQAEDLL